MLGGLDDVIMRHLRKNVMNDMCSNVFRLQEEKSDVPRQTTESCQFAFPERKETSNSACKGKDKDSSYADRTVVNVVEDAIILVESCQATAKVGPFSVAIPRQRGVCS